MAEKGELFKGEKLTPKQAFMVYLWNSETKQFCGRTGGNWLKLSIFYVIFYLCLAAFWALMLLIFYQTIDQRVPKWTLEESRIGTNPGLGFRPRPDSEHVESTLIWFKGSGESWKYWSDNLAEFIRPYQTSSESSVDRGAHIDQCDGPNKTIPSDKFCLFDINKIDNNCTASNFFGYNKANPCVLIKLNRIYNWKPQPYDRDEVLKPENKNVFPKELRDAYAAGKNDMIYITCDGENPADKENIGPINYYPHNGIDFKYFPFTNQPGYLSPFVFVHFLKPTPGVLINIECKAWAKNIKHDRLDREGSVHFELLIDGF